MPSIDSIIELIKLILFMLFVSSLGTQGWIAFLDIAGFFTKNLEKLRPLAVYDKYSRIGFVLGVFVLLVQK